MLDLNQVGLWGIFRSYMPFLSDLGTSIGPYEKH